MVAARFLMLVRWKRREMMMSFCTVGSLLTLASVPCCVCVLSSISTPYPLATCTFSHLRGTTGSRDRGGGAPDDVTRRERCWKR